MTHLRVERSETPFTQGLREGSVLRMPIAHGEGCYFADDEVLARLNERKQIVLKYCDPVGEVTSSANPNGSLQNVAGIVNERGNVFGLMPHPDRACENRLGSSDGKFIFQSVAGSVARWAEKAA